MNKSNKILSLIVIFSLILNAVVFPPQAYARNPFKQFLRFTKKTVRFVITVPDKATRWMGPVLGPAASFVLTKNLLKNPKIAKVFKNAHKADRAFTKAEDIQKRLEEVRKMYRDEAKKMRDKADKIQNVRKQLAQDLLKHGDFDKYKNQVASYEALADIHRKTADKFENSANNLRTNDIIKMISEDFLRSAWVDVRNAVLLETSKELSKVTDPEIIKDFIKGGGINSIVDFFVDRELNKVLDNQYEGKIDKDRLRENIRKSVKEELDKNKKLFKENWEEKINEIIKNEIKKLEEEKDKLNEKEKETIKQDDKTENAGDQYLSDEQQYVITEFENSLDKAIKDDNEKALNGEINETPPGKCASGYVFRPRSGVGCMQVNCGSVSDAHYSYEGRCICGSAGSINENPKDPNKTCAFPNTYSSCPGCTYACVHTDESCPLEKVNF